MGHRRPRPDGGTRGPGMELPGGPQKKTPPKRGFQRTVEWITRPA